MLACKLDSLVNARSTTESTNLVTYTSNCAFFQFFRLNIINNTAFSIKKGYLFICNPYYDSEKKVSDFNFGKQKVDIHVLTYYVPNDSQSTEKRRKIIRGAR